MWLMLAMYLRDKSTPGRVHLIVDRCTAGPCYGESVTYALLKFVAPLNDVTMTPSLSSGAIQR